MACEGIESCCDENWFTYQPCCPPPIVSAGVEQDIEVLMGDLMGTASNYTSILWTQIEGQSGVIFGTSTNPETTFTLPDYGTYKFRLTATNSCGSSFSDITIISTEVVPSGTLNIEWFEDTTVDGPGVNLFSPLPFNKINQAYLNPKTFFVSSNMNVSMDFTGGLIEYYIISLTASAGNWRASWSGVDFSGFTSATSIGSPNVAVTSSFRIRLDGIPVFYSAGTNSVPATFSLSPAPSPPVDFSAGQTLRFELTTSTGQTSGYIGTAYAIAKLIGFRVDPL